MTTTDTFKLYIRPNTQSDWEIFGEPYTSFDQLVEVAKEKKEAGALVAYTEDDGELQLLTAHELR
jgi:hypothetical protein